MIDKSGEIVSTEGAGSDYSDKFIAFEFAGLDYVNPEKNKYAYMLEGFQQ